MTKKKQKIGTDCIYCLSPLRFSKNDDTYSYDDRVSLRFGGDEIHGSKSFDWIGELEKVKGERFYLKTCPICGTATGILKYKEVKV